VRFFVCPDCGDPVPDSYVKRLRDKGKMTFECPCGGTISLIEPKERIRFKSKLEAMDNSADWHRNFDAFIMSAKGETSTKGFMEWASGERVTLSIVFTDVVGSTALGEQLRDEAMNEVRRAHFAQSRKLIGHFKGREVKTIGDSFMAAFKSTDAALDYAMTLQKNTGHPEIRIRAGIHIGPMQVEEGDVFGGTVNFAARAVGAIPGEDIWLSERAKEDIDRLGDGRYKQLRWEQHDGIALKGFSGQFTLWSMQKSVKLFVSYAHDDEKKLKRLDALLAVLEQQQGLASWQDKRLIAGDAWDGEIRRRLEDMDIFLFVASQASLVRQYIKDPEIRRAKERHEAGEVEIVVVKLEPCACDDDPFFGKLQRLASQFKSIDEAQHNKPKAWDQVRKDLLPVIQRVKEKKEKAAKG
jgi:class 3 adenylate cyclase